MEKLLSLLVESGAIYSAIWVSLSLPFAVCQAHLVHGFLRSAYATRLSLSLTKSVNSSTGFRT